MKSLQERILAMFKGVVFNKHQSAYMSEIALSHARGQGGERIIINDFGWKYNGGYNKGPDAVSGAIDGNGKTIELKCIIQQKSSPTVSGFVKKDLADVLIVYINADQIPGVNARNYAVVEKSEFHLIDDKCRKDGKWVLPSDMIIKVNKNEEFRKRGTNQIFLDKHLKTAKEVAKMFPPYTRGKNES